MKRIMFTFMFFGATSLFAQSSFGVKAGLNFADNGTIEYSDFSEAGEDIFTAEGDRKTGYHFGLYYRAELGRFYLKPELLYTQIKSSYDEYRGSDFEMTKLDLPILVGARIIGPVHLFAGPSLQYIMDNDFEGITLEELENEFSVGAQFGIGAQFGSIGIDVRYEQALSEKQADLFTEVARGGSDRLDSRPNQFIVSLSLDL